jgi:hypothetical protein
VNEKDDTGQDEQNISKPAAVAKINLMQVRGRTNRIRKETGGSLKEHQKEKVWELILKKES